MSTAAATDTPAASSGGGGGNKVLLIVVLVFNVLIAGGLGYQVVMGRTKPAAGHIEGGAGAAKKPKDTAQQFGPLIEVGSLVANLSGPMSGHYAKVFLHVEGKDEKAKLRIDLALVPIRAEALLYFNGLDLKDVEGQAKMRTMAEDLKTKLNALIGKDTIKRVYFSEFVIQ